MGAQLFLGSGRTQVGPETSRRETSSTGLERVRRASWRRRLCISGKLPSCDVPCVCVTGRAPLVEWSIWSSLSGSVQSPPQCGVAVKQGPSKIELLQPQGPFPGIPACVYKAPLYPSGLLPMALSVMPTSQTSGESHSVTCKHLKCLMSRMSLV